MTEKEFLKRWGKVDRRGWTPKVVIIVTKEEFAIFNNYIFKNNLPHYKSIDVVRKARTAWEIPLGNIKHIVIKGDGGTMVHCTEITRKSTIWFNSYKTCEVVFFNELDFLSGLTRKSKLTRFKR